MKKIILFVIVASILSTSCTVQQEKKDAAVITIAHGQMPAVAVGETNSVHIVFGNDDSLMYISSTNKGLSFSSAEVIDILPGLIAFATRGPQIATTKNGLAVIAVNKSGDIFSYTKDASGKWMKDGKVNDADTVNKEGFLGLSSDGENNLFAMWTDLRNDKHNKIYGTRSTDGGKTWQKNILVYKSPDSDICECCKPSVVMQGNNVIVMFRNWLHGNRDLYVIRSTDGGQSFGEAVKLGNESWALNGCPMDGGGLAINEQGGVETVWRRKSKIYASEPGKAEKEIGEGKSCTVAAINNKNIYAWSKDGNIICLLPDGTAKIIGKGNIPVLKSLNNKEGLCIWENDKQIEGYLLHL